MGIHASALTHLAPGPSPHKQLAFSGQRAPRAAPGPAPPGPGCQEASWKYHCQGLGAGGCRLRQRGVSLGSLFTSKAEDSEDDEDTEYFDAMEDAASFITVTTEPSEDG